MISFGKPCQFGAASAGVCAWDKTIKSGRSTAGALRPVHSEEPCKLVYLVLDKIKRCDLNECIEPLWLVGANFKTMPWVRSVLAERLYFTVLILLDLLFLNSLFLLCDLLVYLLDDFQCCLLR
jgi:hypothetical protein